MPEMENYTRPTFIPDRIPHLPVIDPLDDKRLCGATPARRMMSGDAKFGNAECMKEEFDVPAVLGEAGPCFRSTRAEQKISS